MNDITKNEFGTNDLCDAMHDVDQSYCGIYEGEVGDLGDVIPFDDAAVFADVLIGEKAYDHFRDRLERISGVEYHDLFDMDRKSVEGLLASLPDAAVEEILSSARDAKAAFRIACQALAAGIKERALKIKFDHGDGLSRESFVDSWRALCADYSLFRYLKSDLQDGGWLDQYKEIPRWSELEKVVVETVLATRDCFDRDQLASQRSEGQPPASWPLGTIDEEMFCVSRKWRDAPPELYYNSAGVSPCESLGRTIRPLRRWPFFGAI